VGVAKLFTKKKTLSKSLGKMKDNAKTDVQYSTDYISINDNGIDLLRNKFPYFHIDYFDMKSYEIRNGYLIRNRFIIIVFAFLLLLIGVKLFIYQLPMYASFLDVNFTSTNLKGLFVIFFAAPLLILYGIVLFRQSFIKSKILQIDTISKSYKIRIKEIDENDELPSLINFLDDKIIKDRRKVI
jgi:hypothetical protein